MLLLLRTSLANLVRTAGRRSTVEKGVNLGLSTLNLRQREQLGLGYDWVVAVWGIFFCIFEKEDDSNSLYRKHFLPLAVVYAPNHAATIGNASDELAPS